VVLLEEKFKVVIDEAGRQRITSHIKTELSTEAVRRRLSNDNDGLKMKNF
jgi:hypothetical protein